jgi:hypothetical protein
MSAFIRSVLLAVVGAGALTPATPFGGQGGPDSGRFTIYKLQHAIGAETWSQTTTGELRELKVEWPFRHLGSNVRLNAPSSAADGTPRQLKAHGQTSTLTDVDLSVALTSDSAVVLERGARRVVPSSDRGVFPMFYYAPVALEDALFRYCRGGSPS